MSKEHGAYVDFIRALRDAMFVLDQQDLDSCLAVLREVHGKTDDEIEKMMRYDFAWFLRRVKRKVPTPPELEERYMSVYRVFKDVVCAKSGKTLFSSKHAMKAHRSCTKHIRRNCLSDIPFVSYYYPVGEDKDSLTLYKCIRGTSALEGLHQKLRQLVRGFSTSPRFMKALVTVYLGRWNHQIEIEVRGMPKKYEGLYDGFLLDEEIEKLMAWGDQDEPLHDEWISSTSFKLTGETFGLIDPVSPVASADASNELEADASIEAEADTVLNTLLELETEVTDEAALLNGVPESARWLALTFGRWRPSGRVKSSDEWDYFTTNIARFQGSGSTGEANNYSSIQWSAFAEDWNRMVTSLGSSNPNFTYKTASLLQDAHQTMQKRARRDTTILPHSAGINNLRTSHTAPASNQRFTNQFVSAEIPTRAMPSIRVQHSSAQTDATGNINAIDCHGSGDDAVGTDFDSPAERARRLGQTKRKRSNPRCRRCGKQWSLDQWKQFHTRPEPVVDADDCRPQNKFLWHGEGNQVWQHCTVAEAEFEPGFPCIDKAMPRMSARR